MRITLKNKKILGISFYLTQPPRIYLHIKREDGQSIFNELKENQFISAIHALSEIEDLFLKTGLLKISGKDNVTHFLTRLIEIYSPPENQALVINAYLDFLKNPEDPTQYDYYQACLDAVISDEIKIEEQKKETLIRQEKNKLLANLPSFDPVSLAFKALQTDNVLLLALLIDPEPLFGINTTNQRILQIANLDKQTASLCVTLFDDLKQHAPHTHQLDTAFEIIEYHFEERIREDMATDYTGGFFDGKKSIQSKQAHEAFLRTSLADLYTKLYAEIPALYNSDDQNFSETFATRTKQAADNFCTISDLYEKLDVIHVQCRHYTSQREQAIFAALNKIRLPKAIELLDKPALAKYLATFPVSLDTKNRHGVTLHQLILTENLEPALITAHNELFATMIRANIFPLTIAQERFDYRQQTLELETSEQINAYKLLQSDITDAKKFIEHQKTLIDEQIFELRKNIDTEIKLLTSYKKTALSIKLHSDFSISICLSKGHSLTDYNDTKTEHSPEQFLEDAQEWIVQAQNQLQLLHNNLVQSWCNKQYDTAETLFNLFFSQIIAPDVPLNNYKEKFKTLIAILEWAFEVASGKAVRFREEGNEMRKANITFQFKQLFDEKFFKLQQLDLDQNLISSWKEKCYKTLPKDNLFTLENGQNIFTTEQQTLRELFTKPIEDIVLLVDQDEREEYCKTTIQEVNIKFVTIKAQFDPSRWKPSPHLQDFLKTSIEFLQSMFDAKIQKLEGLAKGQPANQLPTTPRSSMHFSGPLDFSQFASGSDAISPRSPRSPRTVTHNAQSSLLRRSSSSPVLPKNDSSKTRFSISPLRLPPDRRDLPISSQASEAVTSPPNTPRPS